MSRFEPSDYEPDGPAITYEMWEYNLNRSLNSGKGQALLRTLKESLEALPSKRLIQNRLAKNGEVCAVGAFRAAQIARDYDIDMPTAIRKLEEIETAQIRKLDPSWDPGGDDWDDETWASTRVTVDQGVQGGLNKTLAYAIGQMNDEDFATATPERRYEQVMSWLDRQIQVPA